jgi:hypothetical protein
MSNTQKFVRMKMPMLVTIGLLLGYMAIAVTVTRAYGSDDLAMSYYKPPTKGGEHLLLPSSLPGPLTIQAIEGRTP